MTSMYIPEYGEKIWEMNGVNGELKLIVKDLPNGDHRNGGITCKDGFLYFALGLPSNSGFADPDNHGWTDIPNDPFWVKHQDGLGTTPHDPVCRDIVHTGLNVRSSDGRLTGALMPVGVAAKPGQIVKAQVPCGGSIMRVKMGDKGPDGIYPHEKMEVYAMGFRNQSGVRFGPKGTKWENALAVSDNGSNDLGHRRIANGGGEALDRDRKGPGRRLPRQGGDELRQQQALLADPLFGQSGRSAVSAGLYRRQAIRAEPSRRTISSITSMANGACR